MTGAAPPLSVRTLARSVAPADAADPLAVRAHLDALTKPPGSLGRLEDLAIRLARVYGDPPPTMRRRLAIVLAGDHGVSRRRVSPYPREVTAQMCRNLAHGGAAACVLARAVGTELVVVDVGVDEDLSEVSGLEHRKVARGTRDLARGPAMTPEEAATAVEVGARLAAERLAEGVEVVALGEMGIGNTTAASALTAAILGLAPDAVVGPGTGAMGATLRTKRRVVAEALSRLRGGDGAFGLLRELGGLEIAGMVGVILAAAGERRVVVVDGFIAGAAALVAARIAPSSVDYMVAGHRSAEPGHAIQLAALGLEPLLDLRLRLGEGTGALLAMPLLEAAAGLLRDMATFESAGIAGPSEPSGGGDGGGPASDGPVGDGWWTARAARRREPLGPDESPERDEPQERDEPPGRDERPAPGASGGAGCPPTGGAPP